MNVNDYAKQLGFDGAEYLGEYKGSKIYEPCFKDDQEHSIGIIRFIKETRNGFTITDLDESFEILDKFYQENE